MPLRKFLAILAVVILAAGATIGLAAMAGAPSAGSLGVAVPVLLLGVVLWRLTAARLK